MARYPAIGVFSPFGQVGPFALNFRVLDFMFHVAVARYPSHLFCYNFLCFRCVSFLSRWPDTLPPVIWSIAHLDFTNLRSLCLKDTVPKPSHHQKKDMVSKPLHHTWSDIRSIWITWSNLLVLDSVCIGFIILDFQFRCFRILIIWLFNYLCLVSMMIFNWTR